MRLAPLVSAAFFGVMSIATGYAATRPVIEWVQPPAWRQSADRAQPLLPGMLILDNETVMTGTGGAAEVRLGDRSILVLESTVWTWTGATNAPTGEVRQGGIHTADSTTGLESTNRRRYFRVYPTGRWHLTLALIAGRQPAEQMTSFFRRNGYPTEIFEATENGEAVFRVAIPGFQSREDAETSANALKGRFPGIDGPRADAAPAAPVQVVTTPAASPPSSCIELGPFSPAALKRVKPSLSALIPGKEPRERTATPETRWWVYMPPLPSRADAIKVAADLKRRGIREYFVVQDAAHRNAISLGLFSSEENARRFAGQMTAKGLSPIQVAAREGTLPRMFMTWNDLTASEAAAVTVHASRHPGAAATECQ